MGNLKVLGRLLSRTLLDKQVNCISVLTKNLPVSYQASGTAVHCNKCMVLSQAVRLRVLQVEPIQHFQWGSLLHRRSVGQSIDFLSLHLH